MSEYLCNLVIPGAAKSGTSSLHTYLDQHPQISMSANKEPHHFCRDERYANGADAHNSLFSEKLEASIFGESSTGYLPWPNAIERIQRNLDNPKIIILLRDPIERAFSHYRWRYRLGLEKRTFLEAIKEDGDGYDPQKPDRFGYMAYLEFSRYSRHCPLWLQAFGSENVKFVEARRLRLNTAVVLDELFHFLALQPQEINTPEDANVTDKQPRRPSRIVTKIASMLPLPVRDTKAFKKLKRAVLTKSAPSPPKKMTDEELTYAQDKLFDDVAWYERCIERTKDNKF